MSVEKKPVVIGPRVLLNMYFVFVGMLTIGYILITLSGITPKSSVGIDVLVIVGLCAFIPASLVIVYGHKIPETLRKYRKVN